MAGKAKLDGRESDKPTDFQLRVLLHLEMSARLLVLLDRCAVLRDNGQLAKARKVMKQAKRPHEKLLELKASVPRVHALKPTPGRLEFDPLAIGNCFRLIVLRGLALKQRARLRRAR